MLLSREDIQAAIELGQLLVDPFDLDDGNIQPSSIDLRLDSTLRIQSATPVGGITLEPESLDIQDLLDRFTDQVDISGNRSWRLEPFRFVIGTTLETVGLPLHLAGRVEGRSSLARLGIGVHITAPKIDPGFRNKITLEIHNLGPWTIALRGGMPICTLMVEQLSRAVREGYSGVFQGR